MVTKFLEYIENQKVAYHKHEGFPEHPVRVKYHEEYFKNMPSNKIDWYEIDILVNNWLENPFNNDPEELGRQLDDFNLPVEQYKKILSDALKKKNVEKEKAAEDISLRQKKYIDMLKSHFPQFISKEFKGVELVSDITIYSGRLKDDLEFAEGLYQDGKIYLNIRKNHNRKLLPEEVISSRNIEFNLIHEFGHHVWDHYLTEEQKEEWYREYLKLKKSTEDILADKWLKGPTYYSESNYREFFAEVFMLKHIDKTNEYFNKNPSIVSFLRAQKLW